MVKLEGEKEVMGRLKIGHVSEGPMGLEWNG